MSAIFNGSSSFLKTLSAIVAGEPLMFFAWMKPANTSVQMTPWCLSRASGSTVYYQHTLRGDSNDTVNFNWRSGGTAVSTQSPNTYEADVWQAIGGLILSDSVGHCYLNGVRGDIVTGTSQNPTLLDRTTIGSFLADDSPSQFFEGKLAYVTIWSGPKLLEAGEARLSSYQAIMATGRRNPLTVMMSSLHSCRQLTKGVSQTGDVGPEVYANTDVNIDENDNPPVAPYGLVKRSYIPPNHLYPVGMVHRLEDRADLTDRILTERV